MLDVATYNSDQDETGLVDGGYIRIRGRLTEIGFFNGRVSLHGPDGIWDYIKGSDEERMSKDPTERETESWTVCAFDECSQEGQIAISYLDPLDSKSCPSGQVETSVRVTKRVADWPGSLVSLPVVEWRHDEKRMVGGLVLGQLPQWPAQVYQRVGSFTAVGDITIRELAKRSEEKVIMILQQGSAPPRSANYATPT